MAYAYRGSGYLADTVQGTGVAPYLFRIGGYLGSNTEIGYENFGTRVLADGAIIESYACVSAIINNFPTANVGRALFDAYNLRVSAASGGTEARACTINELNYLNQ